MRHIVHVAQRRGIDASVLSAANEIVQDAIDKGYGAEGFSRVIEVLGRAAA
jgi:hypothetical protein